MLLPLLLSLLLEALRRVVLMGLYFERQRQEVSILNRIVPEYGTCRRMI